MASSLTRMPSAREPGIRCWGYRVDGQGFSYTLGFGAVRQP